MLAISAPQMLMSQEAEEDYDLASRGPYEFQFRVDDPETYNKYEVSERKTVQIKQTNHEPKYYFRSKKREILISSRGATE